MHTHTHTHTEKHKKCKDILSAHVRCMQRHTRQKDTYTQCAVEAEIIQRITIFLAITSATNQFSPLFKPHAVI